MKATGLKNVASHWNGKAPDDLAYLNETLFVSSSPRRWVIRGKGGAATEWGERGAHAEDTLIYSGEGTRRISAAAAEQWLAKHNFTKHLQRYFPQSRYVEVDVLMTAIAGHLVESSPNEE